MKNLIHAFFGFMFMCACSGGGPNGGNPPAMDSGVPGEDVVVMNDSITQTDVRVTCNNNRICEMADGEMCRMCQDCDYDPACRRDAGPDRPVITNAPGMPPGMTYTRIPEDCIDSLFDYQWGALSIGGVSDRDPVRIGVSPPAVVEDTLERSIFTCSMNRVPTINWETGRLRPEMPAMQITCWEGFDHPEYEMRAIGIFSPSCTSAAFFHIPHGQDPMMSDVLGVAVTQRNNQPRR